MKAAFTLTLFALLLGVAYSRVRRSFSVRNPGFAQPVDEFDWITPNNRTFCENGQSTNENITNRANTTAQVSDLIDLMIPLSYAAYIVPSSDAHNSEYTADADKRREFISGFTGSAGVAVILSNGTRALWTDSRYYIQADQELDCTWILMKDGSPGVPSIAEWVVAALSSGDIVGADSRLFTASDWLSFEAYIDVEGGIILDVEEIGTDGNNIVDDVWDNYGRPGYPLDLIYVHSTDYAGQVWQEKIDEMVVELSDNDAQVLIISMLDESAWLFNLRGSDVPYNPVFRSYVIIDTSDSGVPAKVSLFIPDIEVKTDGSVQEHLNIGDCSNGTSCVEILDYEYILSEVSSATSKGTVEKVLIPTSISYYVYSVVPEEKIEMVVSPIMLEKAWKNPTEQEAMKEAHRKDATALYRFLYDLETNTKAGNFIYTEITAADNLTSYRNEEENNMGLSFETISAFGPNSAIIHYTPNEDTDKTITNESIYLLDSGGQYYDGTIDVTRTFHFGDPDPDMIEAYTRVAMGQIDLALTVIPFLGESMHMVEVLTRRPLWEAGLGYYHGPTHGIGQFLSVHEGSSAIWELGWHGSDEPGFYLDGYWGIRLESVLAVVNVSTKYDFVTQSTGFETITLFHYETNLLDTSLLNQYQCNYINNLHANIQDQLSDRLSDEVLEYMINKTQPVC